MRNKMKLGFGYRIPLLRAVILFFLILGFSIEPDAVFGFQSVPEKRVSAKKLLKRAKAELRRGLTVKAEKLINQAIKQEPENSQAKLDLAYVYLKQRKFFEAFDLAFPIARDEEKNARAFAIVGTVYLTAGRFAEARTLLSTAIAHDKSEALAWASMGMLDYYTNRVNESLLNLEEAVYHDRREADFEYALAQVSSRSEQYKKAAEAYERFLRIAPKTDKERRDRIRGLIDFLQYLGRRSGLYDLGGESGTTVKIEIINNRPIVEMKLNRHDRPLRFVLDTGAGISVLSRQTARELGIREVAKGGLARALGGDGKFEIVYGFVDTMQIGEAKIRNVPVYIREFPKTSTKIDGYIGLSLIAKFVMTLDYRDQELTLVRRDEHEEAKHSDDSTTIPLRLTSSGFLSGIVNLPGIENGLFFIVDTGASVTVVSESLAENEYVKQHLMDRRIKVVGAAGVTEGVAMFNLRDLSFGGASSSYLTAVALNLDLINETSGFEQAGILGGNFLRDYKLTFDFRQSKVTLTPY